MGDTDDRPNCETGHCWLPDRDDEYLLIGCDGDDYFAVRVMDEWLGTTEKDIAWVWTVDWTYTPDDTNMQTASTGHCLGSGGMIDGKPDVANEYCIHNRRDDAKFMSQGQSSPKGSKATMFGCTGSFADTVGGWNGNERIDLPTGDEKPAGCRTTNGEYALQG